MTADEELRRRLAAAGPGEDVRAEAREPCRHQWEHRSSFGDPYRKCLNCGAVEDR